MTTSKTLMETPRTRVLAPVIVDLITIYDYYNDGMDTSGVPIINEPNEGIHRIQPPEELHPVETTWVIGTTRSVTTQAELGSQISKEEEAQADKRENESEESNPRKKTPKKKRMKEVLILESILGKMQLNTIDIEDKALFH